MSTEAKAYLSWKWSPAETRRRRGAPDYSRDHEWLLDGGGRVEVTDRYFDAPDRAFTRMRGAPEEALAAAVASSHMFAFLSLASAQGINVTSYFDKPAAILEKTKTGHRVVEVKLRPQVLYGAVSATPVAEARLHEQAKARAIVGSALGVNISVTPSKYEVMEQ
jgi:organic hydroperoxide reductase OsmC/OhrA